MPLEIKPDSVAVEVVLGGESVVCYCRKPTASDLLKYRKELLGSGRKITPERVFQTQVKYGLDAIKSIRKGDIVCQGVPLDELDNWKELLEQEVPQIPEAVARVLYESGDGQMMGDDSLD